MFAKLMACAVLIGVVLAARAADPDDSRFDLTLTKATATRFDDGQVNIRCHVVLDNRTGRVVNVRSTFTSAFDGLQVVIRDEKGKLLHKQGYTYHQSPFAPPGRDFPLKPGENKAELGFPVDLPKDLKAVRVMLVGTLPGSGHDDLLLSDVLPVTIAPAK